MVKERGGSDAGRKGTLQSEVWCHLICAGEILACVWQGKSCSVGAQTNKIQPALFCTFSMCFNTDRNVLQFLSKGLATSFVFNLIQ